MDRETRHELDNILLGFQEALDEIEHASDDDGRLVAWRKVQTLGWRLHQLLPSSIPA